jgi:hypothetical protein
MRPTTGVSFSCIPSNVIVGDKKVDFRFKIKSIIKAVADVSQAMSYCACGVGRPACRCGVPSPVGLRRPLERHLCVILQLSGVERPCGGLKCSSNAELCKHIK